MPSSYVEKVREWSKNADDPVDYLALREHIEFLAQQLFHEYRPSKSPDSKPFLDRLDDWLNSATSESDQKTMFRLVRHILFIGSHEFDTLYQAAFNGPIARWLIDQCSISIDKPSAQQQLSKAEHHTWFGAITDSMQISEFYHVNHIKGVTVRPAWHSLAELADPELQNRINEFMIHNAFERLVLLEDFVGTGNQMSTAVKFAATLPSQFPILVCPMVICPKGVLKGAELSRDYPHVALAPAFSLPQSSFLPSTPEPGESELYAAMRSTAAALHSQLRRPKSKYGPFGYRETGGMVVLHTNCPNNTLPLIHHTSNVPSLWSPLFPRSER